MDATHDRELTPPMQAQNFPPQLNDLMAVISLGGGYLPQTGCFSVKLWALMSGRNADTIHRWVEKYDVPHIQPGDEKYIYAADFHAKFPRLIPSADKQPPGGSRKKKEG